MLPNSVVLRSTHHNKICWKFGATVMVRVVGAAGQENNLGGNIIIIRFQGKFTTTRGLDQRLIDGLATVGNNGPAWDLWMQEPLNTLFISAPQNSLSVVHDNIRDAMRTYLNARFDGWGGAIEDGHNIFNVGHTLYRIKTWAPAAEGLGRPPTLVLYGGLNHYASITMIVLTYCQFLRAD